MIGDESLRHRLMVRVGQPLTAENSVADARADGDFASLASSVHQAARATAECDVTERNHILESGVAS